MLIPVILCGGSGTRLWPLSRRLHPKQFLSLTGERTLLQDTVARLELLNKAEDKIFFGLMPPDDAEQLTEVEGEKLASWISGELRKHNASRLEEKLRLPAHGNPIDHYGALDVGLKDINQEGPIEQFLI